MSLVAAPTRRAGLGIAAIGDTIFLFGGHDGEQPLKRCEVFKATSSGDPRGLWLSAPPMLARRAYLTAHALEGKLYIVGGSADGRALNTMETLEPSELKWDLWTAMPPMMMKRTMHAGTVADGRLFVCGGFDGIRDLRATEVYDPVTNAWQPKLHMETGRSYHALAALGQLLYAIGGQDRLQESGPRAFRSVEYFDLWSERWYPAPELVHPRLGLTACVLDVGLIATESYIFVCGGSDGDDVLSSVERFCIREQSWTEMPPMCTPRLGHAAVALDNKMYVIGGFSGKEPLDTFEVFDPNKGEQGEWLPPQKMGCLHEEVASIAVAAVA
eukprot:TRINITY_DN75486_c0_g1_i1.p1 TRINITY_DN75486_c0_g1~~TRINITY_DN75486_c0_g1_i1.p1  ORF type:complete len:328 (-),score=48.90 TRINITY_DN75486_c0_g1_i1:153-1136(-)